MVLADPGPLLTPPPSSSLPKTPIQSYSAQIRSQNEEKNQPPKPYLLLVSKKTHEYKLALRRQVRPERGEQEPGTATRQTRAAAEGYDIKNSKCYNNISETDEDAS